MSPEDTTSERTISHYRITRRLGEGGMGVVFAAQDERLGRAVAIKMIRQTMVDERARDRLWREARSAASVNHPNICQLYEVGEEGTELFIAMELLDGESLADRIAREPLSVAEASQTALSILSALGAIHRRGLVHRDLKPSNVFITPNAVKLLDFGLARPIDTGAHAVDAGLTMPGILIGTPSYLAPEQVLGQPADGRSDLFAVGAILFEMLTGKRAFAGQSVIQVLHAITHDEPPVLAGSLAIAAVDRVIHRALRKKPSERYPTADDMATDLRSAMLVTDTGETIAPRSRTRLIVLPFRILRPDPDTDFLAFSLPDALTGSLSGLESLVVRSSISASRFAGDTPDLEDIATRAQVDIVLTGTLLRAGDHLRVVTQLVEAPEGTLVWSQTSQVPLGDIFQLQDQLTHRIIDALSLPLSSRDHRILKKDVPTSPRAYEFYLRANSLGYRPQSWTIARDLYLKCLEEDPGFAPAWARLGRIYRVIAALSGEDRERNYALAQEAFQKALAINPDLSIAHNLYTHLEVEMGGAQDAMLRLLRRAQASAGDAELYAGLVQACRYCGLLNAAISAHQEARRLDPEIRTSVSHAYFKHGDYARAIESNVEDPRTMDALSLSLMGREAEAIALLESVEAAGLPKMQTSFVTASRLLLQNRREECRKVTEEMLRAWQPRDPCALLYLARHVTHMGDAEGGLAMLRDSVEGGYFCYQFLTRDPWLDSLRGRDEFRAILRRAEARHLEARTTYLEAGGERVLGPDRG